MKNLLLFLSLIYFITTKAADTTRVLFIGNSYTYVNDLPNTFKLLGESSGKVIIVDSYAPGGYTLNQHSTNATTLAKIAQGNWDFVVLQEQSQMPSFPPGQVSQQVYPYAHKLDSLIHDADSCAKTVFYMTWGRQYGDASNCGSYTPLCTYEGMQMRLRSSYLEMASNNDAITAPVGMAWRTAWYADSTINLWSSDNSHPSLAGTYLSACTFYATLFRQNPTGLSYSAGLDTVTSHYLQQRASETVMDSLWLWINYYSMEGASIPFTVNSSNPFEIHFDWDGGYTSVVSWDFGDGTTSSESMPTHIFPAPGVYTVTKYFTSSYCRLDSISTIIDLTTVGLNEFPVASNFISISGNQLKVKESFSIKVFNLFSQVVYESDSTENSFSFSYLKSGIYIYSIEYKGKVYSGKFIKD